MEIDAARRFGEPTVLRQEAEPADWAIGADFTPELDVAGDIHGLVVIRHGQLICERYGSGPDFSWGKAYGEVAFGPTTLHDMRSVTKSVVSLLYGIALADALVPQSDAPLGIPGHDDITIHHALTMTLGLEWDESIPYTDLANSEIAMMLAPDRWRYVRERPVTAPPGSRWTYSGGATELIAQLVVVGTGMPLHEYARRALFDPLGIGTSEWLAGTDGVAGAASGLRLTPRDLARIGQAVLTRDVIPGSWLDVALTPHTRTEWGAGYGYQWYLDSLAGHEWVGGIGNGGQRLYVFPALDLVVVLTGGSYDGGDSAGESLVEAVLRSI